MQYFEEKVFFSGTNCEEILSLAACVATLRQLREDPDFYHKLNAYGEAIRGAFVDATYAHSIAAHTIGHGIRFQFVFDETAMRKVFVRKMCDLGVLIGRDFFVTKAMMGEIPFEFWRECFRDALES